MLFLFSHLVHAERERERERTREKNGGLLVNEMMKRVCGVYIFYSVGYETLNSMLDRPVL